MQDPPAEPLVIALDLEDVVEARVADIEPAESYGSCDLAAEDALVADREERDRTRERDEPDRVRMRRRGGPRPVVRGRRVAVLEETDRPPAEIAQQDVAGSAAALEGCVPVAVAEQERVVRGDELQADAGGESAEFFHPALAVLLPDDHQDDHESDQAAHDHDKGHQSGHHANSSSPA
ncbi:hypothetical protein GCM10027613_23080 [Microlunatus endophyticus]